MIDFMDKKIEAKVTQLLHSTGKMKPLGNSTLGPELLISIHPTSFVREYMLAEAGTAILYLKMETTYRG